MKRLLKIFTNKIAIVFIVIVVGLAVAGGVIFALNKTKQNITNPSELISAVGKLIELPSGTPQIATVSDKTKLASQAFFRNAQNGDKVLIYKDEAILYRPSTNKLIAVAPVALQPTPVTQSGSPTPAKIIRVAIFNGTKTAGIAKKEGDSLVVKHTNFKITDTLNASGNYSETLIVDLTGKNKDLVASLAKELSGKVGPLPSVEAKPDADILIILGGQ